MNTSCFLDQLLKSAQELMGDTRERARSVSDRLESDGVGGIKLGKFAQGAIAAGAVSLLLGSRGCRKLATYGGLAAFGTVTYRAYRDYQQRQSDAASSPEPQTVDRLPASQVEMHSRGILVALIAAAKSDGHIDERERALIRDEIGKLSRDSELQAWVDTELSRPLDAGHVAASASTPEMASEMYLASLLIVDERNERERGYLDQLAAQLKLDPMLKNSLEKQISGLLSDATPQVRTR